MTETRVTTSKRIAYTPDTLPEEGQAVLYHACLFISKRVPVNIHTDYTDRMIAWDQLVCQPAFWKTLRSDVCEKAGQVRSRRFFSSHMSLRDFILELVKRFMTNSPIASKLERACMRIFKLHLEWLFTPPLDNIMAPLPRQMTSPKKAMKKVMKDDSLLTTADHVDAVAVNPSVLPAAQDLNISKMAISDLLDESRRLLHRIELLRYYVMKDIETFNEKLSH